MILSFYPNYVTQSESDKTEYATLTVGTLYDVNGNKKEIIREKYENNAAWVNSEGTLIERFAVNNGEIYGFGRRNIGGEYKFFMYHYNLNGNLIETSLLLNLEKIIEKEQPVELYFTGDYIVFRTYESLSTYICKISNGALYPIAKGNSGRLYYAVSKNTIFFMETNVDVDTATVTDKKCTLYAINIDSGEIKKIAFTPPVESPYFTGLIVLENGDLVLSYCEKEFDPLNRIHFIIPQEELQKIL